jgi:hypothetical protein
VRGGLIAILRKRPNPRDQGLRGGGGAILLLALAALAACVPTASPSHSCSSDCAKTYETAMTVCKTTPQDPTGVDSIQACLDTAQRSYGNCQMNCTGSSAY